MIFFTSDLHLGESENRMNLYGRDLYNLTTEEFDNMIIEHWNEKVSENDTVYIVGDAVKSKKDLPKLNKMKGNKILIEGNYDEDFDYNDLSLYFKEICENLIINLEYKDRKLPIYLNHYPVKARKDMFNIVGHVHGLWKVQRNMLNVSCDCYYFYPLSTEDVFFYYDAIKKHYDENVFAGESDINL